MKKLSAWLLFVACLTLAPLEASQLQEPVLAITADTGGYAIRVEIPVEGGTSISPVLRRTVQQPKIVASGWGSSEASVFATWQEQQDYWSSYSLDGGTTWSEAKSISLDLLLLDGASSLGSEPPAPYPGLELPPEGQLFLVQFYSLSLPEWRAELESAGADILAFFPRSAHIVRLPENVRSKIDDLSFVARVVPFHPSYRLEPDLRAWINGAPSENDHYEEVRVNILVAEWGPEAKERVLAAAATLGARVADYWPSGHLLELWVDAQQVAALAGHDDVLWIDRWSPPETDMGAVRTDTGAWSLQTPINYCGIGVRGEVMDSGIEAGHIDIQGVQMHTSADVTSHGTSTYAIVFGKGLGNLNALGLLHCGEGIFADNNVVSDRFAHTQELKNAPYFASFQSNSWGSARTTAYTSRSHQMDDIIWRLDIAITQSQSNAGNQDSRPQAWAKNIISVGGVKHFNTVDTSDDSWSGGASIGPAADGRLKPDVSYWYDWILTATIPANNYTPNFGGTSAASPEAAGVLGMIAQMWGNNVWNTNPQGDTVFEKLPSSSTLKALLINSAKQYPFVGASHDLTRTHQGWGRPNALQARDRAARSLVVDEEVPLRLGQNFVRDVYVPADETELKITMVYPDPPGTTSASLHRINDLSLRVRAPSGAHFNGNHNLDVGNYSLPGGAPNDRDTVENVYVDDPESGWWRIEVVAEEVNQDAHLDTPEDDAAFALVATGVEHCGEDPDADTIGRPCDNCPDTWNAGQEDNDGDGVGNDCDNCLADSNAAQLDRDGQVFLLEDFETGAPGWSHSGSNDSWHLASQTCDGIENLESGAYLSNGNYGPSCSFDSAVESSKLVGPVAAIAGAEILLQFDALSWDENGVCFPAPPTGPGPDSKEVGISTDGGATYTALNDCTALTSPPAGARTRHEYDISSWSGQNVNVVFAYDTANGAYGHSFAVDNVRIVQRGDGIGDVCDNCPSAQNPNQTNSDTDSHGDACDNCPAVTNEGQENGDTDSHGNVCDNCPTVTNEGQENADSDSHGDACDNCPAVTNEGQENADTDSHGDVCDNCPSVTNEGQQNGDTDTHGDACDNCPAVTNEGQENADTDSHGDVCDNCPSVTNEGQENGDTDSHGNVCDNCPSVSNEDQRNTDGDTQGDACDLDDDNDGIPDETDNCPLEVNPDQADRDKDGRGNACDNCVRKKNPGQEDGDSDGVGDVCDACPDFAFESSLDSDNDGIPNDCDNCVTVRNRKQTDSDADGLGDSCDNCKESDNPGQENNDGDAFGNICDNCPDLASKSQRDRDGDGQGDACDPCPRDPANQC